MNDVAISNDVQTIVERMARAKWISGNAFVTPEKVEVQLTELGRKKVNRLSSAVRPFEDRYITNSGRVPSFWQHLKLRLAFMVHALALTQPALSHGEDVAFITILAIEARKLRLSGNHPAPEGT
jgi:hypothetical protein